MSGRLGVFSILSFIFICACSSSPEHAATIGNPDVGPLEDTSVDTGTDTALPATCTNGVKDGDETDVDCGGKTCKPCDTNGKCTTQHDCSSISCVAGVCAAPKCNDNIKNGGETDIDCGAAPCDLCADGKVCTNETNCRSGVCTGGTCTPPSCTDGVKNNGETDIDCGGACQKCGVGKKCSGNIDCTSDACAPEGGVLRCTCPSGMSRVQLATSGGGAYCIDTNEVTNNSYGIFLSTGPDKADQPKACAWNDNFAPSSAWPATVDEKANPVRYVDWCDALMYCKKQGKRLCGKIGGGSNAPADVANASTSQWYNACSQSGSNLYCYGGTYSSTKCNGKDAGKLTVAAIGDSTFGKCIGGPMGDVLQLSGNVKEWEDSCDGDTGAADNCLARGGSFNSDAEELKCAGHATLARNKQDADVGFRCCL